MSTGEINHETSQMNYKIIGLTLFLFVIFVIFSIIFSLYLYQTTRSNELNVKEDTPMDRNLHKLRSMESQILSNYRWENKKKGQVRIPIELAKKKVLDSY